MVTRTINSVQKLLVAHVGSHRPLVSNSWPRRKSQSALDALVVERFYSRKREHAWDQAQDEFEIGSQRFLVNGCERFLVKGKQQ